MTQERDPHQLNPVTPTGHVVTSTGSGSGRGFDVKKSAVAEKPVHFSPR